MIPAQVIDALLAAGATAEMIAAAVKADAAIDEAKLDAKRAKDRDRKRRSRDVTRRHADTSGNRVTSADPSPPSSPPSSPSLNNPPSLSPTPAPSPGARRRSRGVAWPEGFEPDRDVGRRLGWSEERITIEIGRFRNHAVAKGSTYCDWGAAWRNWTTSPYQGAGNGQRSRTALQQAGDDLIARLESAEREDGLVIDHDPG